MKKEKTFEEALEKYETETSTYKITIPGTPINYLRERSGRNHFYNPSSGNLRDFPDGEVLSFGGDHYHSVGAAGAVDGCRTIFQDFD